MNKAYTGILGFCFVVLTVVLTLVVCVFSYRYVSSNDHLTINAPTDGSKQVKASKRPRPAGRQNPERLKRARNPNVKPRLSLIASVDEDDFLEAQRLEKTHSQHLQDEADRANRKDRSGDDQKPHSYDKLPDEEKNRIWWEIANVASFSQGESITYTLTINQGMRIGSKYGTSVLEVFRLFREGADADWRTAEDPAEIEEE